MTLASPSCTRHREYAQYVALMGATAARAAWPGSLPSHRAACGIGFVAAPGEPSHDLVSLGVTALARLAHRGALDADGASGDGAGVLIQVPRRIFGPDVAVATLFAWDPRSRDLLEAVFRRFEAKVVGWREVPIAAEVLGRRARADMPEIWQAAIDTGGARDREHLLYVARRA